MSVLRLADTIRTGRPGLRGAWRRPYWDMPIDRSMPPTRNLGSRHITMIVIGIDAHKRTHATVVVDRTGRQLSTKTIGNTSEGHLSLLRWATEPCGDRRWAIEDCRHQSRRAANAIL